MNWDDDDMLVKKAEPPVNQIPKSKVVIHRSRIADVIKKWEQNPQAMFDWRSKALKTTLLVLESIVTEKKNPRSRGQNMAKIRAAEQLLGMFEKMGAMRAEVPVACPKCGEEFIVP